jgi:hypothetical protein
MKIKDIYLGERVYIVHHKEIKEAYVVGLESAPSRILSHIKLPRFRIIYDFIYRIIGTFLTTPNMDILKYVNLKPLFLLLMKRYTNTSLQDLAAFFSISVNVIVEGNAGQSQKLTVLGSRVFKTRLEAYRRNLETGKYCPFCGTEYLRNEAIPKNHYITPCKKCRGFITKGEQMLMSLLPFDIPTIIPTIPNGIKLTGIVFEGKIVYPYKNDLDKKVYKKLLESPEWKVEDVVLAEDSSILSATFGIRNLLKLKTRYSKKDHRKPILRVALQEYGKYLDNHTYNKPTLKAPVYENTNDLLVDQPEVFSDNTVNILPVKVYLDFQLPNDLNSSVRLVCLRKVDISILTAYKLPSRFRLNIYIERVLKNELLSSGYYTSTDFIGNEGIFLFEVANLIAKEIPTGKLGFLLEYTDLDTNVSIKEKSYFDILPPTTIQNYGLPSYITNSSGDIGFFGRLNQNIFCGFIPLRSVYLTYTGVSTTNVVLKINDYPFRTYSLPNGKVIQLEDITSYDIKTLFPDYDFSVLRLSCQIYKNGILEHTQISHCRLTDNYNRFVKDSSNSVVSPITVERDYRNSVYNITNDLFIRDIERPFKLIYILADFYETTADINKDAPMHRSIMKIDIDAVRLNHVRGGFDIGYKLKLPVSKLPQGTYNVVYRALLQYAEHSFELAMPETDLIYGGTSPLAEQWGQCHTIILFNTPEGEESTISRLIQINGNDAYANLEQDGSTLVNFIVSYDQFTEMATNLAALTKMNLDTSTENFLNFGKTLVKAIDKTALPEFHSPRLIYGISKTDSYLQDFKNADKAGILEILEDLPTPTTVGKSLVIQAIYSNLKENPSTQDSEGNYESYSFQEDFLDGFLLTDIRDALNQISGYAVYNVSPTSDSKYGEPITQPNFVPLMITGRNLAKTNYSLGNTVFFLKQLGGAASPVHSIHSGILESIQLNLPAKLPKFLGVEKELYAAVSSLKAVVLASVIPKLGPTNPPDLPMEPLIPFTVDYQRLYPTYFAAKEKALWAFCIFCGRFKPKTPTEKDLKQLLQLTEYMATGEVDDPYSNIPTKFRNYQNIKSFEKETMKKTTFNSKLKTSYRGISEDNLVLAMKFKETASVKTTEEEYSTFQDALKKENEYFANYDKNLFTSDYELKKKGLKRDPMVVLPKDQTGSSLTDLALDPNADNANAPNIARVFPNTADRVNFLLNMLGQGVNNFPPIALAGISPFDKIIKRLEHAQKINDAKLDELRSKMKFGAIDLGAVLGSSVAEHITICPSCQNKIKSDFFDILRKISNLLLGFPIDATKELKFYTIDYVDVEFENNSSVLTKYDFVLPLNQTNKEYTKLKEEIAAALKKL